MSSKLSRLVDDETEPENPLVLEVHAGNDTNSKSFKAKVVRRIITDHGFLNVENLTASELSTGNWQISGVRVEGTGRRTQFGLLVSKQEVARTTGLLLPANDRPGRIL